MSPCSYFHLKSHRNKEAVDPGLGSLAVLAIEDPVVSILARQRLVRWNLPECPPDSRLAVIAVDLAFGFLRVAVLCNLMDLRRSYLERNPEAVPLVKKLARCPVNLLKRTLRQVAAELEAQGEVSRASARYAATAIARRDARQRG
jgi:hypothetical protein